MMMGRERRRRLLLTALLLGAVTMGCQRPPPPPHLVPVQGKVVYHSRPVSSAQVQFLPESKEGQPGVAASAWTNAEGVFSLQSHPHGAGAAPGRYRVVLSLYPGAVGIPTSYADASTTRLIVEILENGLSNQMLVLTDDEQ